MSEQTPILEEVVALALKLSSTDKARLMEEVKAALEDEVSHQEKKPKRSLRGLWAGVNISEEDIAEARREMWGNFPREDI